MSSQVAFCFRSGQIGFGPFAPKECLTIIAHDNPQKLQECVKGFARRAYDNVTLLVPGVPEAKDDDAALAAVIKFGMTIKKHIEKF